MKVSIYKNIFDKDSKHVITIDQALHRIKSGKSKKLIETIRSEKDKEIQNADKRYLPCVTFSGVFDGRYDDGLVEHSGFICLDFDLKTNEDALEKKEILKHDKHIYACWISPSNNGVKALYLVKDGMKHTEYFKAISVKYPSIDKSGINISRVCYESYDADIYINNKAVPFDEIIEDKKYEINTTPVSDEETYRKIVKWLEGRGDTFSAGSRNQYIFKLASACCRFGIDEVSVIHYVSYDYLMHDNSFTRGEAERAIKSAYKSNRNNWNTATFNNNQIVEVPSYKQVDPKIFEEGYKLTDIIYGQDIKDGIIDLYDNGFESAETTHINTLDAIRKWKKGQVNFIGGIANMGKSAIEEYLMVVKSYYDGTRWAIFSPENYPAHEWYMGLTEILMGCDLTPNNPYRPTKEQFLEAFDFIKKHFFYIYPETLSPTPDYIKVKFMELIIKEGVEGCVIDPLNMLEADYNKYNGRDDRYLGWVLSEFGKFARENHVYFSIVAHPHKLQMGGDGNYPCPNIYDLAGGAMIPNRVDNIFMYHRPYNVTDPMNPIAEYHSKKVKKQRLFKKGMIPLEFDFRKKRFTFEGYDPLRDNKYEVSVPVKTPEGDLKYASNAPF